MGDNYGKIDPIPLPPPTVLPTRIPLLVKNPFGLDEANYIGAFRTNQPNGGGSRADEWNKVMDELEKLDHPKTKEMAGIFSTHSEGVSRFSPNYSDNQNTAVSVIHQVLSWIKSGGDNVVCNLCQVKSDRLTNYKPLPRALIGGNPLTLNIWHDSNGKFVCNECYEKQKIKGEVFLQNAIKRKYEEEERNKCSCILPLSKCGNCLRKIQEAYRNDPRPPCEKCGSKENTTILKYGNEYHRTCDGCMNSFEVDNPY